jgi:hypothetical protein
MLEYDVHANQKNDMAKGGAAIIATLNLYSGGTGFGAHSLTFRSYLGLKKKMYWERNDKNVKYNDEGHTPLQPQWTHQLAAEGT